MHTIDHTITAITSVAVGTDDVAAARFIDALGVGDRVRAAACDDPTAGFRGYTISLTSPQPGDVRALVDAAVAAGGEIVKPVAKSLWGVGGVVRSPDGALWKFATSAKKDDRPVTGAIDRVVLLLGAEDVGASKRFYAERGLPVGKSFGSYAEFELPASPVQLGLYKHRALAKDAGVDPEGSGSHRLVIDGGAAAFTDPDGFSWAPASAR